MFSALVERLGASELTEVRRQRQAYQAKASLQIAPPHMMLTPRTLLTQSHRNTLPYC